MPDGMLPLFPLSVVLFPDHLLPLHIFEERYKEMIGDAIRQRSEFGVVLAAESGVVNTGCAARVESVLRFYPDGRLDIVTRGARRFEILTLNEEMTYLRGEVQFFDDVEEPPPADELRAQALERYRELRSLDEAGDQNVPDAADPRLSFRIADAVPDLGFRQVMLATRSEADRMRRLVDFLPEHIEQRRRVRAFKAAARHNGRWN